MRPVYFVGAGPGDPELLTLKAARLLAAADVVVYAGSLVNPELLRYVRAGAELHDSSGLTLEEMVDLMARAWRAGLAVVRLHSGDPGLYGAVREQIEALERLGIPSEVVPGVSSFLAAAAALRREYTLPGTSQTVILTRLEGRTPVPAAERLAELARHRASLCLFLSVHMIDRVVEELRQGYPPSTPVAVVERVSWPGERVVQGTLEDIADRVREAGINRTALILVGDFLTAPAVPSRLYSADFGHGYRGGRSGGAAAAPGGTGAPSGSCGMHDPAETGGAPARGGPSGGAE